MKKFARVVACVAIVSAVPCWAADQPDLQLEWVKGRVVTDLVPSGQNSIAYAQCLAGKKPISGSWDNGANRASFVYELSRPDGDLWRVSARNIDKTPRNIQLTVYVLCGAGVPVRP